MKSITIINPQNSTRFEKSHNFVDIIFWKKYFQTKTNYVAKFYTKKCVLFSQENNHYFFGKYFNKEILNHLLVLLSAPKSQIYLLQSYYEPAVISWLSITFFLKKKIYLISTNNISDERIRKPLIKLSYKFLKYFKAEIFVHSDFEKRLLSTIYPLKLIKFKHYHLWDEILDFDIPLKPKNKNRLLYPGPVKRDKPVKYFNCILENKEICSRFSIVTLLNCRKSDFNFIEDFKSHEIFNTEYSDLYTEFSNTQFIFLPHDKSFSGKLSGNLLDSISFGMIPISNKIQPVSQLFELYGDFGIILDYDNENWVNHLECRLKKLDIDKCQSILAVIRKQHTQMAIFKTLDEIFQ